LFYNRSEAAAYFILLFPPLGKGSLFWKRMEIFFLDAEKGEIFFHPLFHGNQLILFRGKTFSVWKRVSFSAEKYPFSMEKDE